MNQILLFRNHVNADLAATDSEIPAAFPAWFNDGQYAGWAVALRDYPDAHDPSHWLQQTEE